MSTKTTELEPEKDREPEQEGAPPQAEKPVSRKPSALRNPRTRRALLIAGVVVAIIALVLWLHYRNRESTDDAQVNGHIIPIAPRVSGSVIDVLVRDNQSVQKGQVLVRLDPRDFQAKLDDAKAALALAQSRAQAATVNVPLTSETTHSGTTSAGAVVAAAQANYEQTNLALQTALTSGLAYAQANVQEHEAKYQKAESDLTRMKPLAAKSEISQQQYDGFVAAEQEAKSQLDAARQNFSLAQQTVSVRRAQVASAKAELEKARAGAAEAQANTKQVTVSSANAASARAAVEQAQANLNAAQLNLDYTTIVAPEDGTVTNKTVEVGEILQAGQGLLLLVPLNDVWVTANFKETQLAHVKPGDRAEIHVDMYGKTLPGHVDSISGATGSRLSLLPPENATGNYVKVVERIPVKILLDPGALNQAILRPGMNVEATIITK
ncbi:MAG TPA: HlyD family secretion protein [Candidatus Acidoferrales bacterium]|nr:HlyD family secretion protein [Candidatus Acidoferrales bacterium]